MHVMAEKSFVPRERMVCAVLNGQQEHSIFCSTVLWRTFVKNNAEESHVVQYTPLDFAILCCNGAVSRDYDVVAHQFGVLVDSLMSMVFGNLQTPSARVSMND